ncbi:MAG: hypothetical protein H7Y19_06785 [Luteimonas sp.]|nr:hypothetical protein [Luteimonas sp.]
MFNPHPRIDVLPIDGTHACYVIDDALSQPQQLVEYARANRERFEMAPHNAYPGLELRMPDDFSDRLDDFFRLHVRARLGARRTQRMYSRLSMATLSPEQLQPPQWICHRDRMTFAAKQCIAASVLYLFHDVSLGGTAFFVAKKPAREIDVLIHESGTLTADDFAGKYGAERGYLAGSNDYFEKVLAVPAKWNRLIFYDGDVFHTGDIRAAEKLSDDPDTGRLTLNGFFTCSKRAA